MVSPTMKHLKCCKYVSAVSLAILLTGCDKSKEPATFTVVSTTQAAAQPVAPPPATPPTDYITTGPLVVDQQTDIVAERDGPLMQVLADIGDHVRKGQTLIVFDDRELRSTRAAKSAKVDSVKALVQEAEAEQHGDEADLRRAEYMLKESIISQEDYEHTKFKLSKAVAEVASYRADQSSAEYDLHAIDVQLEQSHIVAPFAGIIGRRNVRVAQEVKKGDPLLWLTAEGPLQILFTVPESEMPEFHTGAILDLTSALYPGLHQVAVVRRVSPVVDPASGSLEVVGKLDQPSPILKPGMPLQVRLSRP